MGSYALHKKTYNIGYSDVDFTKGLKCSTLFGYFQDTAGEAADRLGAGIDVLTERYGVSWVLARMSVEFDRIPMWNESITVETWPHPPGRLEFERDFRVRDAQGNIIVKAVSNWVLIDINTRELKRSDTIEINYPPFIEDHALDRKPGRLKPSGPTEAVYRKFIGYSDVDINGHINNSRYIDYIMDCLPVEIHREYRPVTIDVHYMKETFPGDTMAMYRDDPAAGQGMAYYIEGVNESDGKPSFKAMIELAPRQERQCQ